MNRGIAADVVTCIGNIPAVGLHSNRLRTRDKRRANKVSGNLAQNNQTLARPKRAITKRRCIQAAIAVIQAHRDIGGCATSVHDRKAIRPASTIEHLGDNGRQRRLRNRRIGRGIGCPLQLIYIDNNGTASLENGRGYDRTPCTGGGWINNARVGIATGGWFDEATIAIPIIEILNGEVATPIRAPQRQTSFPASIIVLDEGCIDYRRRGLGVAGLV